MKEKENREKKVENKKENKNTVKSKLFLLATSKLFYLF